MSARKRLPRLLAFVVSVFVLTTANEPVPADEMAHLDLEVTLNPVTHELRAVATFAASRDSTFVLHKSLTVRAVTADGAPAKARVVRQGGDLRLWSVSAAPGAKLRIRYGGTLPALDRSLIGYDGALTLTLMTSGQGSYLPAGSGWYPRPARLFTYRISLTLPADQRGLVPGRLIAETLPHSSGAHYRATFVFGHPARGITLIAGRYHIREKRLARPNGETIRLRTYFYPELGELGDAYLQASAGYIELYSQWIGDYPFASFSVVTSPRPTVVAIPTLAVLSRWVLPLRSSISGALGHEVLHNWWGNGVYIDYAAGNWAEGLTTFMADHFLRARESAAEARQMRHNWLRYFARSPDAHLQSLASFGGGGEGAGALVGYAKGAMVFLMLRDLIGEDAFDRGIRLFWRRNRFKAASWDDLRRAFEDAASRPLATFFQQWVQRPGAPKLVIARATAHGSGAGTRVTLTLTQSRRPYQLRVPLVFMDQTHVATRWITLEQTRRTLSLKFDWMPDSVRLDPNFRLWRALDGDALTRVEPE